MTFECFLIFLLLSTCVKTSVQANECSAKLLPNISPSFKQCNLILNGTLTVDLKDFVDRPQCLNENSVIGVKFNQELDDNDWDKAQNLDHNTVVTFHNTETLCKPVNVTIGLSFWDGNEWVLYRGKFEFNPTTCKQIQTKCPNLTTRTTTLTSSKTTTIATTIAKTSTATTTTTAAAAATTTTATATTTAAAAATTTTRTRTTTTTRTRTRTTTRIGPLYKASPYLNKGAAFNNLNKKRLSDDYTNNHL